MKENKRGITLIALIISIIVMLILVGVTVTVSLNGGLFEKAREGAKGTTIEKAKEQILADIAVKMVDKEGRNITEKELKKIVKKYGELNEGETILKLNNTGEEIPLNEIWNNFDVPQKNEYGYYTNCVYGDAHIKYKNSFTDEQLEELEQYYQTEQPNKTAANNNHKNEGIEWRKKSELSDYDIGDFLPSCYIFEENSCFCYISFDGGESFVKSKSIQLIKENGRVYRDNYYPFFFSEDGNTLYVYNEGS